MGQFDRSLPLETSYVVYDVSYPVLGKDPRYGQDADSPDDWLIVVHCGDSSHIALGVVPAEDYTAKIAASARAGSYDSLLSECG